MDVINDFAHYNAAGTEWVKGHMDLFDQRVAYCVAEGWVVVRHST